MKSNISGVIKRGRSIGFSSTLYCDIILQPRELKWIDQIKELWTNAEDYSELERGTEDRER